MESYSALAASYDELTQDVGYEKRAAFVEKLFLRSHIPVHTVLDLACGTGEITRSLLSLGHKVTAIDFSEDMLARARAKHGDKAKILAGDAERLLDDDESYDALVTRHLVWTLTDPQAALATWARVLRPGGALVIVDGDWASESLLGRAMRSFAEKLAPKDQSRGEDMARHRRIMADLPYGSGLTYARLSTDLRAAGFAQIRPLPLWRVYRFGMRSLPLSEWLRLNAANRFALVATT